MASRFSCFVTCNLTLELTVAFAANETFYFDVGCRKANIVLFCIFLKVSCMYLVKQQSVCEFFSTVYCFAFAKNELSRQRLI